VPPVIVKILSSLFTPKLIIKRKDSQSFLEKYKNGKENTYAGTGRAGTTFLVSLLTDLGFDTGYTYKK
jgi:hypothetical protein